MRISQTAKITETTIRMPDGTTRVVRHKETSKFIAFVKWGDIWREIGISSTEQRLKAYTHYYKRRKDTVYVVPLIPLESRVYHMKMFALVDKGRTVAQTGLCELCYGYPSFRDAAVYEGLKVEYPCHSKK